MKNYIKLFALCTLFFTASCTSELEEFEQTKIASQELEINNDIEPLCARDWFLNTQGSFFRPGALLNVSWSFQSLPVASGYTVDLFRGDIFVVTVFERSGNSGSGCGAGKVNGFGNAEWLIPSGTINGIHHFRIRSVDSENEYPANNSFTISSSASGWLGSPNGGEQFVDGDIMNITWGTPFSGTSDVVIDLYKDDEFQQTISSGTNNDGSFNWTVPQNAGAGATYQVKITDGENPSLFDFSNSSFSVEALAITKPAAGDLYRRRRNVTVEWCTSCFTQSTIDIEVYKGPDLVMSENGVSNTGISIIRLRNSLNPGNGYRVKIGDQYSGEFIVR